MNWDNHGEYWVADHVIPIKKYLDQVHPESLILNWINIKPVVKKYNSDKHKNVDKIQCEEHLKNVEHYYQVRKLEPDTEYIRILEEYCL